jgi:hypothetical protein
MNVADTSGWLEREIRSIGFRHKRPSDMDEEMEKFHGYGHGRCAENPRQAGIQPMGNVALRDLTLTLDSLVAWFFAAMPEARSVAPAS